MKSIIFFDQHCRFCCRFILFLLKRDHHKCFLFAPLTGVTARQIFVGHRVFLMQENSVVLIEEPQDRVWLRGKAVCRILWLLKGPWRVIGWAFCLPFIDVFYRIVACHRAISAVPISLPQSDQILP